MTAEAWNMAVHSLRSPKFCANYQEILVREQPAPV